MPNTHPHTVTLSTGSILKVFTVLVGLVVLFLVRDIIAALVVSIILAAALSPAVKFLEAWRIPRWLSILLAYTLAIGVISLALILIVPPLVDEIVQLTSDFPNYYKQIRDVIIQYQQLPTVEELPKIVRDIAGAISTELQSVAGGLFNALSSIVGGFLQVIFVLVLTFYLLAEPAGLERFIRFLVPLKHEEQALRILYACQERVAAWLRGQLLLSFLVGLAVFVGLSILGVRSALVLALIAAITELVPIIGPILGAVPAVFLALTQSPLKAGLVVLLFLVVQQLENNLLVPRVMRRATGLDPVVTILAILVGGKLGGIGGMLVAVPLVTILSVFYDDFVRAPVQAVETPAQELPHEHG